MRFTSRTCKAIILCMLLILVPSVSSEALILDQFEDGNADGWMETSSFPGTVTFDVVDGSYLLHTNGVSGNSIYNYVASRFTDSMTPGKYVDSALSLDTRINAGGGLTGAFLRSQMSNDGYGFTLNAAQNYMVIMRSVGSEHTYLAWSTQFPINVGVDYTLKMQAEGNQLDFKFWETGTAEPDWMLTGFDSTFDSGGFGIVAGSGHNSGGPISTSFDNVFFSPEPGTGLLVGLGMCGMAVVGRRRSIGK